ncbi:MAG: hypothetical protein ACREVS_10570 [Burkholderiales bacterium]
MTRVLAALAVGLALAGAAAAQTAVLRTLPEDAKRGTLSHVRENLVTLDGKQIKLAPGAQIRGANNLIVQPAALPKDSLVKYQLNGSGELFRAWVLTAQETAARDKSAPPSGVDAGRPFSEIVPQPAAEPLLGQPRKP